MISTSCFAGDIILYLAKRSSVGLPRVIFTDEFGVTYHAAVVTETDLQDEEGNTFKGLAQAPNEALDRVRVRTALGIQRDGAAHGYKSPHAGGASKDDAGLPPRRAAEDLISKTGIVPSYFASRKCGQDVHDHVEEDPRSEAPSSSCAPLPQPLQPDDDDGPCLRRTDPVNVWTPLSKQRRLDFNGSVYAVTEGSSIRSLTVGDFDTSSLPARGRLTVIEGSSAQNLSPLG